MDAAYPATAPICNLEEDCRGMASCRRHAPRQQIPAESKIGLAFLVDACNNGPWTSKPPHNLFITAPSRRDGWHLSTPTRLRRVFVFGSAPIAFLGPKTYGENHGKNQIWKTARNPRSYRARGQRAARGRVNVPELPSSTLALRRLSSPLCGGKKPLSARRRPPRSWIRCGLSKTRARARCASFPK